MNYTLGSAGVPGKPKKVKRTGPKPTGRKEGEASKKRRMGSYTAEDNKKVDTTNKINTQSKKMIEEEGLRTNNYGLPDGKQQHKKFKLGKALIPKFLRKK